MNHIVRVRDLVGNPTAADIKGFLEVMADEQVAHFLIVYDVPFAHRQVAVEEAEWGRLGCQLEGTAAQTMRDQLPTLLEARKRSGKPLVVSCQVQFTDAQLDE